MTRTPPFVEDENKRNEKGFRDALILETVCFIANSRKDTNIAFITNDGVLRSAVKDRLKNQKHCSFYETLDEFSSFLRLLNEKLENEFVQAIQKRAKIKFYNEKDTSCLLTKEEIIPKIREKYTPKFTTPNSTKSLAQAFSATTDPVINYWKVFSNEGIWVRAPSFVNLEGESEFLWDSIIIFAQLFMYTGPNVGGLLGIPLQGQENLRKLEFKVTWKARVGRDARFLNMELVNIELAENKFVPASEEEMEPYMLNLLQTE